MCPAAALACPSHRSPRPSLIEENRQTPERSPQVPPLCPWCVDGRDVVGSSPASGSLLRMSTMTMSGSSSPTQISGVGGRGVPDRVAASMPGTKCSSTSGRTRTRSLTSAGCVTSAFPAWRTSRYTRAHTQVRSRTRARSLGVARPTPTPVIALSMCAPTRRRNPTSASSLDAGNSTPTRARCGNTFAHTDITWQGKMDLTFSTVGQLEVMGNFFPARIPNSV